MTKKKQEQVIEGPEIRIRGQYDRFEIVRRVVNTFIEFEKDKKGRGIEFRYPVEDLSNDGKLYIHRPGVKWNFDFKVEIPENCGMEEGRHDQIALLLRRLNETDSQRFTILWKMITSLYTCSNNDVDSMLLQNSISYENAPSIETLLKVIKWLFIMEDIIYWHYEGRAFLYNFFSYVINEPNKDRLERALIKIRKHTLKPKELKTLLKECGKEWQVP